MNKARPNVFCKITQLILSAGLAVFVSACGGSSSGTPSSDLSGDSTTPLSDEPNQNIPTIQGTPAGAASLAFLQGQSKANTQYIDLQVDAAGVQHAVMTDGDLWVYYLSCSSRCGQAENWSSLQLEQFNATATGYAIGKLQIDRNGNINVAVMAAASLFTFAISRYYRCEAACAVTQSWTVVTAREHTDSFLPFRVADTDWFALSQDGLPRIASVEKRRGEEVNGSLTYTACQRLPCSANDWVSTRLTSLNRALSRPAEIVTGGNGEVMIAVQYQSLGSDNVQIVYLACDQNCDGTNPVFSDPISVDEYTSRDNEQERMRLSLGPDGRLHITLLDYEPGADQLVHHACIRNCSSLTGEWEESNPLSGNEVVGLSSSFGRGLDVATVDGELRIYVTTAGEEDRVATVLLGYACSGSCDDGSTWQLRPVGTTRDYQFADRGGCVYVGTEMAPPISASGPAVSFTLQPTYYCNFVPDDVTLPDSSDILTFPVASVLQLR